MPPVTKQGFTAILYSFYFCCSWFKPHIFKT